MWEDSVTIGINMLVGCWLAVTLIRTHIKRASKCLHLILLDHYHSNLVYNFFKKQNLQNLFIFSNKISNFDLFFLLINHN